MKKTFIIFGLIFLALPFLGFPQGWKDVFVFLAGLMLLSFAFFNRRVAGTGIFSEERGRGKEKGMNEEVIFVESEVVVNAGEQSERE